MSKLLIQFKDSWSDEIDIVGFHVLSGEAWGFLLGVIPADYFPGTIGVGANQELRYATLEGFLARFTIQEISDGLAAQLSQRFDLPFGQMPMEQIITGLIEDHPELGIQDRKELVAELAPGLLE